MLNYDKSHTEKTQCIFIVLLQHTSESLINTGITPILKQGLNILCRTF